MNAQFSCTAGATSDISTRLIEAVQKASPESSKQLEEVQDKIEELKRQGLLRRQKYTAATAEDFQKLFLSKS